MLSRPRSPVAFDYNGRTIRQVPRCRYTQKHKLSVFSKRPRFALLDICMKRIKRGLTIFREIFFFTRRGSYSRSTKNCFTLAHIKQLKISLRLVCTYYNASGGDRQILIYLVYNIIFYEHCVSIKHAEIRPSCNLNSVVMR